jgi:hypothetical protein
VRTPILAVALMTGCGARTGLLMPDAGPRPPEQDAGNPHDCVILPQGTGDVTVDLDTDAHLAVADVMFVVDATDSMDGEIGTIRERLQDRIVPGIARALPDVEFGVAAFADFPVNGYGTSDDRPFRLLLPVTSDLVAAQAAVDEIPGWSGEDLPESQVEALYQVATGEGLDPWVLPRSGCPSGGMGYACFRSDAIPIVVLFTDAPFHNGPGGADAYDEGLFPGDTPHTFDEATAALDALGARFIGLDSGDSFSTGRPDMVDVARAVGSVTSRGSPLVFDIGSDGDGLDHDVVDAIETLADAVPFDVDALALDVPGDAWDATQFVVSIAPLRADPADGVESMDATTFHAVVPGTSVTFLLTLRNDAVVPGPVAVRIPLRIVFRGDGHSPIGEEIVDLVIPGADGSGDCPAGE